MREHIGYAHLPLGVFSTDDHAEYEDEEFALLMHEYTTAVQTFDEEQAGFNGARGQMTITQDQPGLKKINWEIFWFDAESKEGYYQRSFWLHKDSIYWEQYGPKPVFVGYLTNWFSAKE